VTILILLDKDSYIQTKLQADSRGHKKCCLFLCHPQVAGLFREAGYRCILGEKGRSGVQGTG
jgi:hypothetical protein